MMKKSIILLLLALFSSCSPSKKVDMTPKIINYKSEYESKAAGGESLFRMGSYSSLKEAFRVYQELLSLPVNQEETKEKLIKTSLLLTLREKELAILDEKYLGKLYTQLQQWRDSGLYFERAALCNEFTERGIRGKIEELSVSSLSEERKERIIRRKEGQLKRIILFKGTAYYNAAAGYFNSGLRERALTCAQKACSVPSLKQKAEELILLIKEDSK